MRTDAVIDKVQVECPDSSTLGFDKTKAQVGDLVFYHFGDDGPIFHGRMIGRIHHAPAIGNDKGPIKNWLLVAQLSPFLDQVYERWINPLWVVRVNAISGDMRQKDILAWFMSDDMVKAPQDEVRACVSEGWSSLAAYRHWKEVKSY
jgi:hypothetical protein